MSATAVRHLASADRRLARLIRRVGPIPVAALRKHRSPYESLVQAIVYQQLNGKAASTILGRVRALFPGKRFPAPSDLLEIPGRKLRSAGLSRAKVAAVKDIAKGTLKGQVPTSRRIARMTDIEIIERLVTLRGVGQWTVEMLLIFQLGRPDVLPVTDYGIRKGFALTYGLKELPSPREILEYGERWRPFRTTASFYLWRANEK
jgi:DNA-3-methyladenine glycosylase II